MEINSVNSKYEDEQSLNSTLQRKLKEHQVCLVPGTGTNGALPPKCTSRQLSSPQRDWPRVLETDPCSPHSDLESKALHNPPHSLPDLVTQPSPATPQHPSCLKAIAHTLWALFPLCF